MKAVHFHIDPMDLQCIEKMIRDSDSITAMWPVDLFDRYSLGAYVRETHVHESKFFALFDRNIYTDIIAVAKSGGTKPHTAQQRVACALLAFLQLAEVIIEPNQAISEYVDSGHHEEAVRELRLFRAVDNLDSRILIELALGQRTDIPASMLNLPGVESVELKSGEDFRSWRIHYGFVLKLALIELQEGKPVEKLERFIDWVYKDYVFTTSAILFASVYFSNKRFKGMVKSIGSGDKDRVLRGLRNTTWDLTIAHYWYNKAIARKADGIFWLLCTADRALKAIAGSALLVHTLPGELEQKKRAVFCNYLGDEKGGQIHDKLTNLEKRRGDSSRRASSLGHISNLYPVADELEKELLLVLANRK